MAITLRDYQISAVETIVATSLRERYVLLQLSTGGGKTIIFSELIRRYQHEYNMRILVLAHRKELIEQAADKLLRVWPEAPIGIACAGVDARADLHQPVVIGSVQTVVNRLELCRPFHLVIIDEAHRLPPRNVKSQYQTLLLKMESLYPQLRVLGVTATPYRLGHGYIYGRECKKGHENWFENLHFSVRLLDLQSRGYLVPIRAKEAENIDDELRTIRTSGGDWNLGDLSDLMSNEFHVNSAVHAYREYGEGRRHVVVFCVTIDHAKRVRDAFARAGFDADCVHSQMPMEDRQRILHNFDAGRLHILCNVGVLTEGWDCTCVDCILLCRPTKSPGLHVQIVGRGLRPHPGKENLLVLDLSGNMRRHGPLDDPNVVIPGSGGNGSTPSSDDEGYKKLCPRCKLLVRKTTVECPECGYLWEVADRIAMREITLGTQSHLARPKKMRLMDITPRYHISKAGNAMLKLIVAVKDGEKGNLMTTFYHFWDVEGNASKYGRSIFVMRWLRLGGSEPVPATIQEAMRRLDELRWPEEVLVKQDGQYLKVSGW